MSNAYVNKVELADGTSIIDISDTTAMASDVVRDKYFYAANGAKVTGTLDPKSVCPKFTVRIGTDWSDIVSVTCSHSYNQLVSFYENEVFNAEVYVTDGTTSALYGGMIFYYWNPTDEYSQPEILLPDEIYEMLLNGFPKSDLYPALELLPAPQDGVISYCICASPIANMVIYCNADGTMEADPYPLPLRTDEDVTVSGDTLLAPWGYYHAGISETIASGSEGTPSASKGSVSNHSISVTPSVTNTGGYIEGGTKTGSAVTVSASELVSGNKEITANGTGIDVTNYATVSVAVPSSEPELEAVTNVTPTESSQTITPSSGYDGLASVQINAISSSYVGSSVPRKSSSDLTASGDTVTVPSGYYSSSASKAVASGSAGTPTATKGSVSNHSISVTPSVTNSAGYIEGGTKTGSAVTVSASELVSGSETKTSNGTYDVTNLASLVVNVSAGKNAQMESKVARTSSNTYTDMGFEITVAKAGTYDIYWTGYRSSTGGTNGAQIYKNGTAVGTVQTTFNGTYTNVQNGHVSNVSLAVNDKITIRARARSSSYYMYIMNLVIIEA